MKRFLVFLSLMMMVSGTQTFCWDNWGDDNFASCRPSVSPYHRLHDTIATVSQESVNFHGLTYDQQGMVTGIDMREQQPQYQTIDREHLAWMLRDCHYDIPDSHAASPAHEQDVFSGYCYQEIFYTNDDRATEHHTDDRPSNERSAPEIDHSVQTDVGNQPSDRAEPSVARTNDQAIGRPYESEHYQPHDRDDQSRDRTASSCATFDDQYSGLRASLNLSYAQELMIHGRYDELLRLKKRTEEERDSWLPPWGKGEIKRELQQINEAISFNNFCYFIQLNHESPSARQQALDWLYTGQEECRWQWAEDVTFRDYAPRHGRNSIACNQYDIACELIKGQPRGEGLIYKQSEEVIPFFTKRVTPELLEQVVHILENEHDMSRYKPAFDHLIAHCYEHALFNGPHKESRFRAIIASGFNRFLAELLPTNPLDDPARFLLASVQYGVAFLCMVLFPHVSATIMSAVKTAHIAHYCATIDLRNITLEGFIDGLATKAAHYISDIAITKITRGIFALPKFIKEKFSAKSGQKMAAATIGTAGGAKNGGEQKTPGYVSENGGRVPLDGETILHNKSLFERTNYQYQKATIYRNKENGWYYYRDKFHKGKGAHLEAFNHRGKHQGNVNPLTGELIPNTADPKKQLRI